MSHCAQTRGIFRKGEKGGVVYGGKKGIMAASSLYDDDGPRARSYVLTWILPDFMPTFRALKNLYFSPTRRRSLTEMPLTVAPSTRNDMVALGDSKGCCVMPGVRCKLPTSSGTRPSRG